MTVATSPPNSFTAGTKIQSGLVNENFDDVYDELALRLKPVTFSAVPANATQALGASEAWTKVTCDSEEWDDGGWYDTALSRFTPQTAGVYRLNGYVRLLDLIDDAQVLQVAIYKNGAIHRPFAPCFVGGTDVAAAGGGTLVVADGSTDYFELYAAQESASTRRVNTDSYFQGSLERRAA